MFSEGLPPAQPMPAGFKREHFESFRAQTILHVVHMNRVCRGYGTEYTADEYVNGIQAQVQRGNVIHIFVLEQLPIIWQAAFPNESFPQGGGLSMVGSAPVGLPRLAGIFAQGLIDALATEQQRR